MCQLNRIVKKGLLVIYALSVLGCSPSAIKSFGPSEHHIGSNKKGAPQEVLSRDKKLPPPSIPKPLTAPVLPAPSLVSSEARHTVVVNDVPVKELLFSLARDAELNLDISSDVEGTVTINAVNQTLESILTRITEEGGLAYDIKNNVLRITLDKPYLHSYRIDYLNMARSSQGLVSVSTQISSTGQGAGEESGSGGGSGGNNSSATQVDNVSKNAFWETLEKNIAYILESSSGQETSTADANNNIVTNKEAGVIAVRATQRQHAEIQKFIDEVQYSTRRQVLIEATIAEVKLSDSYQAGIDWSFVKQGGGSGTTIFQDVTDLSIFDRPGFSLTLSDADFIGGNPLDTTLRALETFGDVKIMSSPKVMAMNNQTALLKVVDNLVYFTMEVNIESSSDSTSTITYETEVNTVPVGFVMSVTPYINEHGSVTLNVRPTISRVIDRIRDPSPALAEVNVISEIPVIQVREIESILKVSSGDIAVIGGLMQDEIEQRHEGVPVLAKLPWLGSVFRYDNDKKIKTELVIFIKTSVVNHASLTGDLKQFNDPAFRHDAR